MSTPNSRAKMTEGQYRRYEAKSARCRKNARRAIRRGDRRTVNKWDNALFRIGACECAACRIKPAVACWLPGATDIEPPDALLCWYHLPLRGFCGVCNAFVAGLDDVYLAVHGMCTECLGESSAEFGEDVDEDGIGSFYP